MAKKRVPYRNLVIVVFIALLWLPFASFSGFYPFYRFGMFAELGASQHQPNESFAIYYSKNNRKYKFDAPLIGMNASTFEYLKRNYYYRKNSKKLLKIVMSRFDNAEDFQWELYQLSPDSTDSTLLVVFPPAHNKRDAVKSLP